jgi:hypothetical protein
LLAAAPPNWMNEPSAPVMLPAAVLLSVVGVMYSAVAGATVIVPLLVNSLGLMVLLAEPLLKAMLPSLTIGPPVELAVRAGTVGEDLQVGAQGQRCRQPEYT